MMELLFIKNYQPGGWYTCLKV